MENKLLIGDVKAARSQVCPERVDMIHPNFRKLCRLCADTDEWGQIQLLTMLTRYCRCAAGDETASAAS